MRYLIPRRFPVVLPLNDAYRDTAGSSHNHNGRKNHNFKSITVISGPIVRVKNPTSCTMIGKGSQGAVFKLSAERCVKIYAERKNAEREIQAYKMAHGSTIVPKLHETGPDYIVMEYISGLSLKEYFSNKRALTEPLTRQILFLLKEMGNLGFLRQDLALRHILITRHGELKMIDLVHALRASKKPKTLFKELKSLGLLGSFLDQVKNIDISIYKEWKNTMSKYT